MRRRVSDAVEANVDCRRFRWDAGVGPDRFFQGRGYPTAKRAAAHWSKVRRQIWATCRVGEIPVAARAHDGLTTRGRALLRSAMDSCGSFDVNAVIDALKRDREAVKNFAIREPSAAAAIADFLAQFLAHLERLETAVRSGELDDRSDRKWWRLITPLPELYGGDSHRGGA